MQSTMPAKKQTQNIKKFHVIILLLYLYACMITILFAHNPIHTTFSFGPKLVDFCYLMYYYKKLVAPLSLHAAYYLNHYYASEEATNLLAFPHEEIRPAEKMSREGHPQQHTVLYTFRHSSMDCCLGSE